MAIIKTALCLFLGLCVVVSVARCDVTVQTTHGAVRGYRLDVTKVNAVGSDVTHVNMFLGIPYAEPPVGDLRFARPVPKSQWKPNVLYAKHVSPACPQPLGFLRSYSFGSSFHNVDEDCLYLNIYSPYIAIPVHQTSAFPVMVWIHGGSYKYGSGAEYDGRVLAQEGVVVVTLNYRLGALGFLSTDDDHAPGNYGLLDQLLGLQWVKNNIASFQGDPNRITIFGQSAGGGSVSLHMFSPRAKGLFQSAIPQSGCALSPWAIYRPPHTARTYATKLARALGCSTSSSRAMVTCLRQKSFSDIANTRVGAPPMISTFAPRVDGFYITDLPEVLLERGGYLQDVQVMTGYVPQEVSEDLADEPGIDAGLSERHLEQMFSDKSARYLANARPLYGALLCAYPPSPTDTRLNRQMAVDMNSDYGYVAPHIKMAAAMGRMGTNVWLYDFTYRSSRTTKQEWIGVPHSEELYYVFGAPFLSGTSCPGSGACPSAATWGTYQRWGNQDEAVSLTTMKIWTSFAKLRHGAHVFRISMDGGMKWPPYHDDIGTILNISSHTRTVQLMKSKGIRFWESFNYLNLTAHVPDVCNAGVPVGR